jgi:hypothetical protein
MNNGSGGDPVALAECLDRSFGEFNRRMRDDCQRRSRIDPLAPIEN